MNVLVVNAGSASLKLRLVGPADTLLAARDLATPAGRADQAELAAALGEL
ncbi:acetate/propionate family kinase, partial [Frankia sp. AiPs1]|nr:acetate/propionate family kinase [Frankia sp. AiPs1]